MGLGRVEMHRCGSGEDERPLGGIEYPVGDAEGVAGEDAVGSRVRDAVMVQRVAGVQFPTSQGEPRQGEPAEKYAANDLIRRHSISRRAGGRARRPGGAEATVSVQGGGTG